MEFDFEPVNVATVGRPVVSNRREPDREAIERAVCDQRERFGSGLGFADTSFDDEPSGVLAEQGRTSQRVSRRDVLAQKPDLGTAFDDRSGERSETERLDVRPDVGWLIEWHGEADDRSTIGTDFKIGQGGTCVMLSGHIECLSKGWWGSLDGVPIDPQTFGGRWA